MRLSPCLEKRWAALPPITLPNGKTDANGLPIEIYAFTNTVIWAEYEDIQADIFDHIFAVVDEFGLRIHQSPTGNDIRSLAGVIAR